MSEVASVTPLFSGLERAVAKISRVRGTRWILWRLGQAVLKPTRLVLIENHRVWQARAESIDEIRWCARVHDCLHRFGRELDTLIEEGDKVLPDQPLPRKITHRVRKRGPQTLFALALLSGLLAAGPSAAQDHTDVVRQAKTDAIAAGANLTDPCGVFAVAHRAAWALRTEQAGLLRKLAGDHPDGPSTAPNGCWRGGRLFSSDIVIYPDGQHYDILIDSGGTNGPHWDLERCTTIFPACPILGEPFRRPQDYVSVLEVGAPVEQTPIPATVVPIPVTPPPAELAEIKVLLTDLADRVTFLSDKIDRLAELEKEDTAATQHEITELRQAAVSEGRSLSATILKYLPLVGLIGAVK
jgi:hypothetical protein